MKFLWQEGLGASRSKNNPALVNAVLGLWLFLSAVLWPHSRAQLVNALLTGAVIGVASLASARTPRARYVATAAATWLLVSSWVFPMGSMSTFWNNLLVAFVVFFLSLVAPAPVSSRGGTGPAARAR